MKKIVSFIFASLLFGINVAQQYQVVRSDRTVFFGVESSPPNNFYNVDCIRIDSLKVMEQDSIFYPFGTIYQLSDGCYDPFGPTLMGKQIVIQPNAYNLLFNKNDDTIKIKTNAKLNESWFVSQIDNIPIMATVIEHQLKSFLEMEDSVKTVQFQPVNKVDSNKHSIFGLSIEISKNYGIVNGIDFREFPNIDTAFYNHAGNYMNKTPYKELLGLNQPEIGLQNLTWFDVFNFEAGNEIHTIRGLDYGPSGISDQCLLFELGITQTISKYLEREDFFDDDGKLDHIVYTVHRERYSKYFNNNDTTYYYFNDTIKSTINKMPNFDLLPGYSFDNYPNDEEFYNQNKMHYLDNRGTKVLPVLTGDICYTDTCFTRGYCVLDGLEPIENYVEGLGGPYYENFSDFRWLCERMSRLVYYQKDNETWGTPLDIVLDVEEPNQLKFQAQLFPNPSNQYFILNINQKHLPAVLNVLSIDGKIVKQQLINHASTQVQVDDLNSGIYLLKINNKNQMVASQRIIVER